MNFSIVPIINDVVSDREDRRITSWNCSKLGTCLTGVYLERLGVKPDTEFDDRTLRVFSAGKTFENWTVEKVLEGLPEGMTLTQQIRIENKELGYTGYADFVLEQNGDRLLYEIKSKNSRAFWYMVDRKEGANRHHLYQTWLYLYTLGIDKGVLAYISKDDLTVVEYPLFLNDKSLKSEVMAELDILNRAWEAKLPPPVPEFDKKDWRPKYCRWHRQCTTQPKYLI